MAECIAILDNRVTEVREVIASKNVELFLGLKQLDSGESWGYPRRDES